MIPSCYLWKEPKKGHVERVEGGVTALVNATILVIDNEPELQEMLAAYSGDGRLVWVGRCVLDL